MSARFFICGIAFGLFVFVAGVVLAWHMAGGTQ